MDDGVIIVGGPINPLLLGVGQALAATYAADGDFAELLALLNALDDEGEHRTFH